MTFSNSLELLAFHNVAYSIYAFLILSVIAWFAYNLTKKDVKSIVRIPFYGYMAFLVAGGVGHHIFTYNTIPWVEEDIMRHELKADQSFQFYIDKHKWTLPQEEIVIQCGQRVRFNVKSSDLVYGFGLFRHDNEMEGKPGTVVTQMQVNPQTDHNEIVWTFRHNGVFDLTSTEYSGPNQYTKDGKDLMLVRNYVKVVGCTEGDNK
jgi:cytochrome c oxidase subunit 2